MTVFHIVSGDVVVGRAPDGVAASDVEPVLGLDARREDGAVRVRDVLARAADAARRDDEREVARRGVVRRDVDGDVLRAPLHALVEEVDIGREAHALDRRLERALGDDERRRRSTTRGARAATTSCVGRHGTTTAPIFQRAEDDLEPVHGAAGHRR